MSKGIVTWGAWTLCVLSLALITGAVVLSALNRANVSANHWTDASLLSYLAAVALAAVVGGLIMSHTPTNPVGWFITGHALCFALGEFVRHYAIYGLVTAPGTLPLARVMASPPYWIWLPGLFLMVAFLPLYFPDGRLVSRRWRPVALLAVVAGVLTTGFAALRPSEEETPGIPNPLGIESLQRFERFDIVILALWLGIGVAAAASLVVRFRRARDEERQQIKWVAYAVVLFITYQLVRILLRHFLNLAVPSILGTVTLGSLWVAIGIAILKYRLYDIDVLINRTLVYGTLTVTLALIYVASIVTLQRIVQWLTGETGSDLVTVASTLAIAALFSPLRRRIQAFIDRRFYRSKYDAAKTLEAFSARLRDDVELEKLTDDLVEVVQETLQPVHVSLWLREGRLRSVEHQ